MWQMNSELLRTHDNDVCVSLLGIFFFFFQPPDILACHFHPAAFLAGCHSVYLSVSKHFSVFLFSYAEVCFINISLPPKSPYSLRWFKWVFQWSFSQGLGLLWHQGRWIIIIKCDTCFFYTRWPLPLSTSSSLFLSVPDHVQGRGSRPRPLCQPSFKLHNQQYLRRERGECVTFQPTWSHVFTHQLQLQRLCVSGCVTCVYILLVKMMK